MNFKRIGRTLICLLMVCALLVQVSPIRAEASAAGLLGSIAGVTSVNVPAGLVYGAAAIALGVAAGANDDFRNMVDSAVTAGTEWVKDGTVELLRVVDEAGKAAYYAAGDMLEGLRSWMWDSEYLTATEFTPSVSNIQKNLNAGEYALWVPRPDGVDFSYLSPSVDCQVVCGYAFTGEIGSKIPITFYCLFVAPEYISVTKKTGSSVTEHYSSSINDNGYYWSLNTASYSFDVKYYDTLMSSLSGHFHLDYLSNTRAIRDALLSAYCGGSVISTTKDFTLGNVASVPIDGSSALDWAPEYQANRLYVTGGNNDPDPPDENNGKWFWPLALTLTAADLYLMSQADEWSGETPQEFDDYTPNTEYEITSRPEFDGYQGLEISPAPEQNPDTGDNPDIGGDTGTDEDAETTWFQRIVKGIEELPSKFGSWLDKILEWLEKIWEGIISIPELLLNGIKALFIPSEDFLTSKVDAIRAEYAFADSIIATGEYIGASLTGLETSPPIIYIHLEDTEGSYDIGGTIPFIDMTWYARYKPTVDALLSALLWIIFCWRIFLKLPGIISGMPGDFVMDGLNHLGGADHLPSRKAGYEVQRMANREQIRRGNK